MNPDDFKSPDDFSGRFSAAPKVRSPHANEDVRCHDHEEWCWPDVTLIKHDSKVYLVEKTISQAFAGRLFRGALYAASSETGEIFIWVVKLSAPTAVNAAQAACKNWCRVKWSQADKGYECSVSEQKHDDPKWGYKNFAQLITAAFAGRVLKNMDQESVKEILGNK